jgi:hypothetical protein
MSIFLPCSLCSVWSAQKKKNKSVSSQRPKCEMSGGVVLFVFEFYMSNENACIC